MLRALPELRTLNSGRAVIEPDFLYFPDKLPDDPVLGKQYDLLDIRAPEAWELETGSNKVRIAILDSGIERGHPSLRNSSILIVHGPPYANLVKGNNYPEDDLEHGTYCSAIAGAKGDDGEGMTGVNWNVTLMPVKFIDKNGCGTSSRAAEAVEYAIRHKADVISASWGGMGPSQRLHDAIAQAGAKGILFVTSAGNSGLNLDKKVYYPASYNLPNMLVVGASDDDGSPLATSGHGLKNVHLSAPGEKVFSAVLSTGANLFFPYGEGSGTSPATAFVSGAAALVKARNPDWKADKLRCRILKSTTPFSALAKASCSGGRLNLEKAVSGKNLRSVCGCS